VASVQSLSSSRFWYASYRDARGKQHLVSTKIEKAPDGATPKERAVKAAENRRLATEMALRLEEEERGNPTEAHLRKVVADISQRVNKRRIEFATVRAHLEQWLVRVAQHKSGPTHSRYKGAVETFLESLGPKAEASLADITAQDIDRFIASRLESGRNPTTIDTDLKALNRPFALALKQGLILTNPVPAADKPQSSKEPKDPFTFEQVSAIVSAAEGEWKTAILIGLCSAARLGDCVSFVSSDFDLETGVMSVRPQKTRGKKKDLKIPIHPMLEAHLLTLPQIHKSNAALCPSLNQAKIGGRSGLSRQFQDIMEAAGVAQKSIAPNRPGGRTFNKFGFHSLRHTLTSQMANAGVASDIRKLFTGHSDDRTHAIYTHHTIKTMREALIKALPPVGGFK
jgi:integrase